MMQIDGYREQLLAAGFAEANKRPGSFYRKDTEWTAFALHVKESPDGTDIEYGWASTAFVRMDGPEALTHWGCLDINLAEQMCIPSGADPAPFAAEVRRLYEAHRGLEKDGLLAIVRKQRAIRKKAIIDRVDAQMKPLGLRRRGAKWQCSLGTQYQLILSLTCSSWAEHYGLELDIKVADDTDRYCYSRVFCLPGHHHHRFDWQAVSPEQEEAYIVNAAACIQQLLATPLEKLGCDPAIWSECFCSRKKCENCWVQKNCWEAKGIPSPCTPTPRTGG